jgi:hypothetical protein
MKTMTCKQLGGTCDLEHRGQDANDIIKAQDQHLKEVVAAGDTEHESALKDMKGRWRRPVSGMRWYKQVQRDFACPATPRRADGQVGPTGGALGSS